MKRRQFRLGSVLRYYELQKQRAESEVQRASRTLQETDDEIARLGNEIAAVAALLNGDMASTLSTAAWIACYRQAELLGTWLMAAGERRIREAEIVVALAETRKKWSVAEETLCSYRHTIDTFNRKQADKAQQELLDETVIQQWTNQDLGGAADF
jgi:flagellar biosynthesis chaperone FliJ